MAARGLIVAAPCSGAGKTTVTLALVAALRRRRVVVRAAKGGPDYIDPAFHAAASGAPCVNLDSWAMLPALLDCLAARAAPDEALLVIESAMGLFDGVAAEPGRTGAAADLAKRFGLPVVLVLNVSGQSQSAAAVARGFALHDPAVAIAGVVLNRVGSKRHRDAICRAMDAAGIRVLGAVPRDATIALPQRHLGLLQAEEQPGLPALLDRLASMAERHVNVDAIVDCTRPLRIVEAGRRESTTVMPGLDPGIHVLVRHRKVVACPRARSRPDPWDGRIKSGHDDDEFACALRGSELDCCGLPPPGQRIALAADAAFSFVYPHLLEHWRRSGAEIVPFSPLADEAPPEDCDACWLPGGYPELYAGRLAAATRFRAGLARFAETRPVHGECGGYMVLGAGLEDADGKRHAMCGLLGHATSFARRRLHLGYREARLIADSPLGPAGGVIRGHEFHYASIIEPGEDAPLADIADAAGNSLGLGGGLRGRVSGAFFHAIARA